MFDLDKFKAELQKRRQYINNKINQCIEENTEDSKRRGMDYEIKLDVLDSIINTVIFMENNDIP